MSQKPSVSLCMIMRDEEDWLPSCLSAIRPFVDQIVCIDTGSKDKSIEIVKSFGAEVYPLVWENDFAAPRNASLQYASCDWVLVLDADEIINPEDFQILENQLKNKNQAYLMQQRHYTNDVRLSGFLPCEGTFPQYERNYTGYFESGLVRLFPNNLGVHYRGRVHELVEHSIYEIDGLEIIDSPVRIHHFGHTPEVKAKKNKGTIYTPMGEEKTREQATDWKSYFELAVEHNNNGRTNESIVAFEQSLRLYPGYLSSWVNYGYVLCQAERYEDARKALIQAIKIDPQSEEAYCNLGVVELRCRDFVRAERFFSKALQIKPLYVNAAKNLSLSLHAQKRFPEAVLVLRNILSIMPTETSIRLMMAQMYLEQGVYSEVEKVVLPVLTRAPGELGALSLLAECCKHVRGAADTVRFLDRHLRLHEQSLPKEQVQEVAKLIDREMIGMFLA